MRGIRTEFVAFWFRIGATNFGNRPYWAPWMKILIIGGYGSFGGRLARLLADEARITLLIAGRSLHKAYRFCESLSGDAGRAALFFDRAGDVEQQLSEIMPDLVVDATGPFQLYGGEPYRMLEACLAIGCDYMDFADSAEFVDGFAQFSQRAQERGVFALSGVSSFPVLSGAVVRRLAADMAQVTAISAGIAPSPFAAVGVNVVKALASYAGKRVEGLRDGQTESVYPLTESIRYTIAPPGRLPLRNLRFSLVNVPDQTMLPRAWPGLQSLWIGAATVPEIFHRMLNGLAWLVRWRLLPTLVPLAPLMHLIAAGWRWGEHRGGMFVAVAGVDKSGQAIQLSWHLLAEDNDGPAIPAMAIAAIVRRCLQGRRPEAGARAAIAELELDDFEAQFQALRIHTGLRVDHAAPAHMPLYQRILGDAWDALPAPVRAMHDNLGTLRVNGRASIERGNGLLARLVARVIGFPDAGQDVPVDVLFEAHNGTERWQRTFGNERFFSIQTAGAGRSDKLVEERFGPFSFGLAPVLEEEKLRLVVRRWRFCGVPLPAAWAPRGDTYEHVEEGRFCFHVEIAHRFTGLIVRYRGWLVSPRPLAGEGSKPAGFAGNGHGG